MASPSLEELLTYRPYVRRTARRLAGNRALADDLEQEAWIVVLRRPPPHADGLEGWFRRVLRSAFLNEIRRADNRRQREIEVASPRATGADDPRELHAGTGALRGALSRLPGPDRELVRLRYHEGWTAQRIAEHQGAPASTVRARTRRLLGRLRRQLEHSQQSSLCP